MISKSRKNELINWCRMIFNGMPKEVSGNESMTQVVMNRIYEVTRKPDECTYMVDTICVLIKESVGKSIEIQHKTKGIIMPNNLN